MKIGQEIEFKNDFKIEAALSGAKMLVREGDKALVTKTGYKILTGEARDKSLYFTQDEKTEGYDLENISKMIFKRLNAVFGLEMYLEDEEINDKEFIEEIEDVLMDIL